jgi:hypothetical protein
MFENPEIWNDSQYSSTLIFITIQKKVRKVIIVTKNTMEKNDS